MAKQTPLNKTIHDFRYMSIHFIGGLWGFMIMMSPFAMKDERGWVVFVSLIASTPFYMYFNNKFMNTQEVENESSETKN